MIQWAIVDTGPLVALLDRREKNHAWAKEQIHLLTPPLSLCEPVVTETMFILSGLPEAQDALIDLIEKKALTLDFQIEENLPEIKALCIRYRDQPMSLADACIVRMAELKDKHSIFTLDSDFKIYKKHKRVPLALIIPGG